MDRSVRFLGVVLAAFLCLDLGAIPTDASANTVTPGTWSYTGSMSTERSHHTATLLRTGKVLITGGKGPVGGFLATAELYDPITGQFSTTGSMHNVRAGHTATLLRNGQVLIDGGGLGDIPSEIYNPASGTFTETGTPSIDRESGIATLLPDGRVLVAYGFSVSASGAEGPPVGEAELFDPSTGTYTATGGDNSCPREDLAATVLGNGQVLMTGGTNRYQGTGGTVACASLYDPASGSIESIGSMTALREGHTSTLLSDGNVLIAGGLVIFENDAPQWHGSAEIYNPSSETFSATGAMTDSRFGHTATLLPNGEVLVAGGANSTTEVDNGGAIPWVDLYDPGDGTFTRTGSLKVPRAAHRSVFLGNGLTLAVGGNDSEEDTNTASAELYTPPNPVNIGAPQQGDIVFGNSVTIEAEYDQSAAQWIDVYVDGKFLRSSPPLTFSWNAAGLANGPHVVSAKAFNSSDAVVGTSAVTVNVANGPVALFWPKENATVSHRVAVAATLQAGVQWADFYVDGKFLKTTPPRTIYWDSTTVPNGSHTLSVKGFNSSDQQVGTDAVVIDVAN